MGKFKELFTKAQERRMDETGCSEEEAAEWVEQQSVGFIIDYTDTWEKVNEEEKLWPPRFGDTYYFVTGAGTVGVHVCTNDSTDKQYESIGNMFKTKEEAEFEIERLKVIAELRSLADDDQPWNDMKIHYYISYSCVYKDITITDAHRFRSMNQIYFKSSKSAENAIKAIGRDKIKKYLFGVEE